MECTKKSVYTIVHADTLKRPLYRRIGVAFVNADQSLSVLLDAFPINGRLHIKNEAPKKEHFESMDSSAPSLMERQGAL
tara:strand:+ start:93 stop:329 length:237 start_codon:yes stop_codon:yes gene_type:complete